MDSKKKSVLIALMVATFLGAVEGTVVTTAIPTIAKDLHGFEVISLVFSAYLLTSAISTPIYGKLSDLYGRKNMLSIGIIIFLIGSSLCGISQTMYMLILFRAVQGLGAGAIFTIVYTIVGDMFALEKRAQIQGIIGTVWGVASLIGPFLGGFLIDTLSWHWIFFINLPFGILSIVLLQKNLDENLDRKRHRIDFVGTIILSLTLIVFMNIFISNNNMGIGRNIFITLSLSATAILLIIFYYVERKVQEPIIPFDIFTKDNIIVNLISFLASAILIGIDVYMPIYIQNILGFNATISGLVMAPTSVAWFISSIALGKYIVSCGSKRIISVSSGILLVSTALLATLGANSSLLLVILFDFIMGIGFGGAFTALTIVVQESVRYNKRGAAVAANSLLRTLGQTIGVSIFGSIFNLCIVKYFQKIGINGIKPNNLYTYSSVGNFLTSTEIKLSLNSSVHILFIILIVLSFLCLILSAVMPKHLEGERR